MAAKINWHRYGTELRHYHPMHGLDGQHQDVDRTLRGRVSQNDRGQRKMEKVCPCCGQPSDRGRLKNRTEHSMYGLRPRPQLTPVYLISMVRTGSARQVVLYGRAVGRFITACPGARVRPVSMDVAIAGGRDGAQGRRISHRLPIAARAV